jgi:hypothetical protein
MRVLIALILLACAGVSWGLETARGLAASGAPALALARIEELQPRDSAAPLWGEWEVLRMRVLVSLGRHEEALKRAALLPATMPRPLLRACLIAAAQAGVASGDGALARRHVARVLWQLEPSADEMRAIRLLVIDSYIAEQQGDAAFRAMLRFQLDYAPLERAVATRFVEGLLALNMEKQAVNWLASLDDASPVKLILRLKTGLVASGSVAAQARAALAKGGGPDYWRVLLEIAERERDSLLRIETLERLLDSDEETVTRDAAPRTEQLWQTYMAEAQDAANRNRMLIGDDHAWSDFAARQMAGSPHLARAVYAYLVQRGRERETRLNAQLQFVYSLQQARLERTALRLFEVAKVDDAAFDVQARYLLGAMAERRNLPALAAQFWKGIPTPPAVSEEEWQIRLATMYWRGGMNESALATLRALLGASKALRPDTARQATVLAQEMVAVGKLDQADDVLRRLMPLTDARQQRDILIMLGRIAESGMQFQSAANYYLRSALLGDAPAPDALAVQARLSAALNLSRAGYREDARAQFQWLLKNAKDPAQLEIARRELAKL